MRRSLFARTFIVISAAVLLVTAMILVAGTAVMERSYIESNGESLVMAARAIVVANPEAKGLLADSAAATRFGDSLAADSGYRVTLIGADGAVIADSGADASSMENHGGRPEVASALQGVAAWGRRKSSTTGAWTIYAAVPVKDRETGIAAGVFRIALPLPGLLERAGRGRSGLYLAGLAAAFAALLASAFAIWPLSSKAASLARRARSYAEGGVLPSGAATTQQHDNLPVELAALERSFEELASRLQRRVAEASELGRRFSAIIDSVGEAILALDDELTIVQANPAAAALLEIPPASLPGTALRSLPGAGPLAELAERSAAAGATLTEESVLYFKNPKTVHANASPLGDGSPSSGVVLAVTDISVLRRLETMRTDFVANVSHELRTPIHLIRGFAETLRGGGLDEAEQERFLEIIERNALRMERIVEDLLSLARLERDPKGWLSTELCEAGGIAELAMESVQDQANAKAIRLSKKISAGLSLTVNPGLMEQALTNLLENAIRYSPKGSEVEISGWREGKAILLSVRDHGSGIPAPDLDRIFERFYRADKSRDRRSGGTGLGLAIVRHIALAHGGSVTAESWAGEGSVFTIRIPDANST